MRLIALLLAFCVPTGAVFAETPGGDAAQEQALYASRCMRCHRDAAALLSAIPKDMETAQWLQAFLPVHKVPDPQMRADLIAYLLTL